LAPRVARAQDAGKRAIEGKEGRVVQRFAAGLVARLRVGLSRPSAADVRAHVRARAHFRHALPAGTLAAQRYVAVDLETTGLAPTRGDAIVAIGAVAIEQAMPTPRSFRTLVDPGRAIPAAATRHHGITAADVQGAPSEAAAVGALHAFAGDAVLVAHNAAFDMACLHAAELRGAPPTHNPALCSQALSQWLDPHEPDHSLDALAARMDEVIEGRHDALGDAQATARLFVRLLSRADARGIDHLEELFRRTRMHARLAAAADIF
jgi:DNA polymerase-3 subunit epsilon